MKGVIQTLLILALAMFASVAAIRVPQRLPDGVYELSVRKLSKVKPYFITRYDMEMYTGVNLTAKVNDDRGPLVSNRHRCSRNFTADHDSRNVTAARAMLSNYCALYEPKPRSVVVAVQGNDVWYMCAYGDHPSPAVIDTRQSCAREEIDMIADRFDRWCGEDKVATVDIDDWHLSYGRTLRNLSFCRRQQLRGPEWMRGPSDVGSRPKPEEDGLGEEIVWL
ncbi:hypothetical protein HDV63DRAFT_151943 [Trichoderma sp. SZMC 28014]